MMRILDRSGNDAQLVGLGDELVLRIELKDENSAFALFARNLYARSSNGESLFLIDNAGCPTDPSIFPALQVDMRDRRSLFSTFKAFRFPTIGVVNFEVQIRFCQEKCEAVKCGSATESFGRRRKRDTKEDIEGEGEVEELVNETETLRRDDSLRPILIPNDEAILAVRKRSKGLKNNENSTNLNRSTLMEETFNSSSESLPEPQPQMQSSKSSQMNDWRLTPESNQRNAFLLSDPKLEVKNSETTDPPIQPSNSIPKPTVPPLSQTFSSDPNLGNRMYGSYGYNSPSLTAPTHLSPPLQLTTRMPTHLSYPSEYYQSNNWNQNQNYGNHYNQNNYPNPHYNSGYHQINQNFHQMNSNRSAYWQPFPYPYPTHRPQSYSEPVTPYQMMGHLESHYPNNPYEVPSTTPKPTKKTRPPLHPSYLEWGESRPARPPPRPSPRTKITASTERPQTQEIPLSLTLMVGDQKDSNMGPNDNNWRQNTNKIIQKRKDFH